MSCLIKLAVAGAGKTTWLGQQAKSDERNLFITYTNRNVFNIQEAIMKNHDGKIPTNTVILTYDRFLYYWLIKPFEIIYEKQIGKINGMSINKPPEHVYKNPHNGYVNENNSNHYKDKKDLLYINRMSKLFCNRLNLSERKEIISNIDNFIDNIYFDEFQDFCRYDYDLLINIAKYSSKKIFMVGDFYQSLVTNTNNRNPRPYAKSNNQKEFIDKLKTTNKNITVDVDSLIESYRCPAKTCAYIREKLDIDIYSKGINSGEVHIISNVEDAKKILQNNNVTKLFWSKASKYYEQIKNKNKWRNSKGDTYGDVCVVLTKTINLDNLSSLKPSVHHSFYVALTRSSKNTYLLCDSLYQEAGKQLFSY